MKSSFSGRVRNFEKAFKGSPLITIQEAVVNSIQAIEKPKEGTVEVKICYETNQTNLANSEIVPSNMISKQNISGFEIIDNGPGFNELNYESFDTLDSEYKLEMGCKGVGRLTWLVVFNEVQIDSHYQTADGMEHISFDFNREKGILNQTKETSESKETKTTIKLFGIREKLKKTIQTNAEKMAEMILDHCLSYYIRDVAPDIVVSDSTGLTVHLSQLYDEKNYAVETQTMSIGDQKFTVDHLLTKVNKTKSSAKVSFCANSREVKTEPILKDVKLADGDNQYYSYIAYVSGDLFNETVESDRSGFAIPDNPDILEPDKISMMKIKEELTDLSKTYLAEIIRSYNDSCKKRLDKFVSDNKEFKYVRENCPDIIDKINPDMSEEELYTTLNCAYAELESKYVFDFKRVLSQSMKWDSDDERIKIFEKMSRAQHAALAKYMSHRKYIINYFEQSLQSYWSEEDEKEKYVKECVIHDIFMPRHYYNHKLTLDNCNLWILDDRLNYYSFTSSHSDRELKCYTDSSSDKRPDLCIFSDKRDDQIHSITVVELKRPGRTDSEVLDQIMFYIEELKKHTITDYNGRRIKVADDSIFHCYILCDIEEATLGKKLENQDFTRMYDGRSYYRWYGNLKAHIEVIDFEHLLNDVRLRNKLFFQILEDTDFNDIEGGSQERSGQKDGFSHGFRP